MGMTQHEKQTKTKSNLAKSGLAIDKKRGPIWPNLVAGRKRMASHEQDRSDPVRLVKKNTPIV